MALRTEPLTPAQAQDLAQSFHDLAGSIGQFRLDQVASLTDAQQFQMQNLQLQCIQYSNTFITAGLFAAQEDLAATLSSIKLQTEQANQTIKHIADVDKALQIATAAAILGASIASMNPSAIASGLHTLATAVDGPTHSDTIETSKA